MCRVKCADCGLLAVRNHNTRDLEEVEQAFRESGYAPHTLSRMIRRHSGKTAPSQEVVIERMPICFVQAMDIVGEFKRLEKEIEGRKKDGPSENQENSFLSVITMERKCPAFMIWHQGFTPKEHKEMLQDLEAKKLEYAHRQRDRIWTAVSTIIGAIIGAGATILGVIFSK